VVLPRPPPVLLGLTNSPEGRPTLVCGGAACGKTLLAVTFLFKGATEFGEPGVLLSFEERPEDLVNNVSSLGYDLEGLITQRKLLIDHVRIERTKIEETGEYDLEGLFIRLGHAIDSIGAKRVALDTVEALFAGLDNHGILRAELRRLFEWLKGKGVTAVVTGERGAGQLTRHGLEEYVSDCVIVLDNRVHEQIMTRRLRVVKYRGSPHGTNEYPFLIDQDGISVMPITSAGLDHRVSMERISSGIPDLDDMLAAKGFFRGSSILVSGMAGSGKTSMLAHFADAVCARGERCIYFALEESPGQILRNVRSISLDLQPWVNKDLLRFSANRPTLFGLETHLAAMHREVVRFDPAAVVVDPISSLLGAGVTGDVHAMILRLIDFLKSRGITAMFSSLTHGLAETAITSAQISSLMDSWLLLYNRESNGEHNRQLYLLKSRGMAHSNQVREFLMTDRGIHLREAYIGAEGVATGSARVAQEARERAAASHQRREAQRHAREIERKRSQIEMQVRDLQAELAATEEALRFLSEERASAEREDTRTRADLARSRQVAGSRPPG
jgi:circadian clock protein KaiC